MSECPTCRDEFASERGVKIHHKRIHNESIAGVEKECNECGDTFRIPPAWDRKGNGAYCSRECMATAYNMRVEVSCTHCGDTVERKRDRVERSENTFCSGECRSEYMSGENHPRWTDGKTVSFGAHWGEIREQILERDDYTCQNCGRNEEYFQNGLHVHHITPRREFDSPEEANDPENLVALCQRCHPMAEHGMITVET